MKRFDDVLARQKHALILDVILVALLVLSIGMTALGVARTWATAASWNEDPTHLLTASADYSDRYSLISSTRMIRG